MQDDPELTAVVRSRQLHIYRNGKKVLVLAGKAAPKIIREDRICVFVLNQQSFFSNLYRLCCKQPFFLWPWLQSSYFSQSQYSEQPFTMRWRKPKR